MTDSLDLIAAQTAACVRCGLAATRNHAVPGHGDVRAPLMLVGEAPGAKEDATGLPFQGLAGRYLDRALLAVGVDRESVFITSVNKCRPPGNRTPRSDEIAACVGYLQRQMTLVAPKVVLAMGGTAATTLHPETLPRGTRLEELRGAPIPLRPAARAGGEGHDAVDASAPERVLLATYHPAAAMRFPARREPFAADLANAVALAGLA